MTTEASTNPPTTRKRQLRQELRQLRRALSPRQQQIASNELCQRLLRSSRFRHSMHIACYLPVDGEIDLRPVISASWRAGKKIYLPVISRGRHMQFCSYCRGDKLLKNRFGLLQPLPRSREKVPRKIDLVLLPLVGFDRGGARLGMGGGYYDRTFRHRDNRGKHPYLLGVAHAIQELEQVPTEPWDQALDAIATDSGYIRSGSGGSGY